MMLTWEAWRGETVGVTEADGIEVDDFGAEGRLNECGSVNLSTLMMNDGTGPSLAFDRRAGRRGAHIGARGDGLADGTQGGDLTCAFS